MKTNCSFSNSKQNQYIILSLRLATGWGIYICN